MKRNHATGTVKSSLTRGAAALSLSALLFTAACSSEAGSGTEEPNPGVETTGEDTPNSQDPGQANGEPANGTVYEARELYPPAVEGEFGYLNLRDAEENRFQAALNGGEDPGRIPGVNILIKHGEPIPQSTKDAIEEQLFQQSARIFAGTPDLPADTDFDWDWLNFYNRTGGALESLSELSGTYVDIVFSRQMLSEDDYQNYNHYVGVRVWDTIGFAGFTDTLEEYLANYEAYLADEGITDYELWVMEPEVKAPWIQ